MNLLDIFTFNLIFEKGEFKEKHKYFYHFRLHIDYLLFLRFYFYF